MINLTANADYGQSGQYVARITGRNSRFTFERQFLGRKEGKRGETTSADVDEPGLYEECDIDRKNGKESRYYVVYDLPGAGEYTIKVGKEDAMKLGKKLDGGTVDWTREALAIRLAWLETKDPEEEIEINAQLGLDAGKAKRGTLVDAIRAVIDPKIVAKTTAAQTLESAIEGCWAILQVLPVKQGKKALAALKARLNPPSAVPAEALEPVTEIAP